MMADDPTTDPSAADRPVVQVHGDASPEEVAAVVAAVELAWPRAVAVAPEPEPPRWRFSGRWWSKPVPARRDRP